MHAEIRKLNDIRLELGLSYGDIADGMTAIGHPMTRAALHKLVSQKDVQPQESTLFKVRKYLEHLKRAAQGERAFDHAADQGAGAEGV